MGDCLSTCDRSELNPYLSSTLSHAYKCFTLAGLFYAVSVSDWNQVLITDTEGFIPR